MGFDSVVQHNAQETLPPISVLFTKAAGLKQHLDNIANAQAALQDYLAGCSDVTETQELMTILRGLQETQKQSVKIERNLQHLILPRYLMRFDEEMQRLSDPESPAIGRQFIERMRMTGCKVGIGEDMGDLLAEYVSYSYGKSNRGFANQVALNPERISEDLNEFDSSLRHEILHALQKYAAPALHFSPFNPDMRVIVHPLDWVKLEKLCEADAYTKQALFNHLEAQKNPSIRHATRAHVVSVADFETHRRNAASLEHTVVNTALGALSKPKRDWDASVTFHDHYHATALRNYAAAMNLRMQENETGHIFVRLDPEDFHAVGAYDVGPNTLGEKNIDPQFIQRPNMNAEHTARYEELCEIYGIPPLESCPTLRNIVHARMQHMQEQMAASLLPQQSLQMG